MVDARLIYKVSVHEVLAAFPRASPRGACEAGQQVRAEHGEDRDCIHCVAEPADFGSGVWFRGELPLAAFLQSNCPGLLGLMKLHVGYQVAVGGNPAPHSS